MEYDKSIVNRAKTLRRQGSTYGEIRHVLGEQIPKSTISYWCSKEPLPNWFKGKLEALNQRGLRKAHQISKAIFQERRKKLLAEARSRAEDSLPSEVGVDVKKLLLAMLHLGEGLRARTHYGLALGSTDEGIVRLYIGLLRDCYNIRPATLKCRVSYRADQNIEALQAYWSRVTLIPLNNFYQTKPDPRTAGVATRRRDYHGVCVVFCPAMRIVQLELEELSKLVIEAVA